MGFALLLARRIGKWTGMSTPLTLQSGEECGLFLSDSRRPVIAATSDNHACGDGFVSARVDEDE